MEDIIKESINEVKEAVADAKEMASVAKEEAKEAVAEIKEEVKEAVPSMEEFKDEINKSFHKYSAGEIVTGPVIGINETEVIIDLGSYAEGIIAAQEMSNNPAFSIKEDVKVGDVLSALVIKENKEGNLVLSVKKADDKLAWATLTELKENKTVNTVKIAKAVKGGVTTYLCGIRAFIPASQLSINYVEKLEEYEGKELNAIVITADEAEKKLVLSAKEVERSEKIEEKKRAINNLPMGTIVKGKVEKLMPFGAFVNIGNGLSGLVHISQISEKRIKTPGEVLKEGEEVVVKLMSVKDGKLNLSIREAKEKEEKVEEIEEAPTHYGDSEPLTVKLGDLFKNIKLN